MLKKFGLIFGIGSLIFVGLVFIVRFTGILNYYSIPTGSSEPNLKIGSYLVASNLKEPKLLDFVCYKVVDSLSGKTETYIHRLCGIEGDKIEIREGVLYVNGKNICKDIDLNNEYVVSKAELTVIQRISDKAAETFYELGGDSVVIFLSRNFVAKNNIKARTIVRSDSDEYIVKQWGKNWNADYFGPITVPEDCYFFVGDNRHNSLDSRYRGFVKVSDFKGTAIWWTK